METTGGAGLNPSLQPPHAHHPMKKVNLRDITEELWNSPKGKFTTGDKEISV